MSNPTCMDAFSSKCTAEVHRWRTCGAGCGRLLAYCEEHGGDDRAAEEMSDHINVDHAEEGGP